MGSPSELSLDVKPSSYSLLLKSFGDQIEQTHHTHKLEEFLARLEEERLKIDAFKRELPLCMQLLNDAMDVSRQQLENYQTNHGVRPVLEEFIPLKHPSPDVADKANMVDKVSWMDSAQLWSQTNNQAKETEQSFTVSPNLALDNKHRSGGAFLPFSKERNTCNGRVLPELALASGQKEGIEKKFSDSENAISSCKGRENCNQSHQDGGGTVPDQNKGVIHVSNTAEGQPAAGQTHRKARRCWSPDLHRRFVNALQQLGGSQVATPKQIRELMKVDGLTNDEVKSHLQKYRLHTRRPSPSPQTATAPATQLVVLGWVPPEYATAAAHQAVPGIYGATAMAAAAVGTPYCQPTVHQDFYSQLNTQQHQLHHHHHHHVYKTSPHTHSSPQSDVGGTGRSESMEEDGKSESGSWKGDSAEKEGGRGLLSLRRVEGEEEEEGESAGSEITLKF